MASPSPTTTESAAQTAEVFSDLTAQRQALWGEVRAFVAAVADIPKGREDGPFSGKQSWDSCEIRQAIDKLDRYVTEQLDLRVWDREKHAVAQYLAASPFQLKRHRGARGRLRELLGWEGYHVYAAIHDNEVYSYTYGAAVTLQQLRELLVENVSDAWRELIWEGHLERLNEAREEWRSVATTRYGTDDIVALCVQNSQILQLHDPNESRENPIGEQRQALIDQMTIRQLRRELDEIRQAGDYDPDEYERDTAIDEIYYTGVAVLDRESGPLDRSDEYSLLAVPKEPSDD